MKYVLATLVCTVLILTACKDQVGSKQDKNGQFSTEELSQQDKMKDGVMVVHDEAMARMAEIHRLVKKLKAMIPEANLDDVAKEEVYTQIKYLEDADDSMMTWMQEVRLPSALRDSMEHTEIMEYLVKEHQKISVVSAKIDKSIESGTDLIKSLEKED